MIVGKGDIASVLIDKPDFIYFASGVSNSREKRESEYDREKFLLLKQDRSKHLVYFSYLAIFYSDTRYTRHKLEMEKLIKLNFPKYTIMRIGNITWGNNPNTLINYLKNKMYRNEKLEIRDEYRYILDVDEFIHWINLIPPWSCEMNVVGRMMKVEDVAREIAMREVYNYYMEKEWVRYQS